MVCWRFFKKSFIENPLKNHYAYTPKISTEELEELQNELESTLHHLTLIFFKNQGNTLRGSTNPATLSLDTIREVEIKRTTSPIYDFNGDLLAEITIFVYNSLDIIYIKCSENPLDNMNMGRVLGILEEKGYNWKDLFWTDVELNTDIPNVEIFGAKCAVYRPFKNFLVRYYNKNRKLRKEIAITGVCYPVSDLLLALKGKTPYGVNALIQQLAGLDNRIKENNRATGVQTEINRLLLAKMDKRENAIINNDKNQHPEDKNLKETKQKRPSLRDTKNW
jgi:hypothetical protein